MAQALCVGAVRSQYCCSQCTYAWVLASGHAKVQGVVGVSPGFFYVDAIRQLQVLTGKPAIAQDWPSRSSSHCRHGEWHWPG